MQKKYIDEFKKALKQQIGHLTIKTNYIDFKIDSMTIEGKETKEEIAKVKVDLNAHKKQLNELETMLAWLNAQK
jgi:peptidoglycan hydrolase CwlO-like protein